MSKLGQMPGQVAAMIADGGIEAALSAARAAGARCGVTRLADITGLDCVGVPVFQAIRPLSRALAVHQGKGLTRAAAQVGALMEAVESAHAEAFAAEAAHASWADLPPDLRPLDLSDFARSRDDPVEPTTPLGWAAGERLADREPMLAPLDCVSLDFARDWERRLDHTSNGLAARLDLQGALRKGLLEVIERDARGTWRRLPSAIRSAHAIDRRTIPYGWYADIAERLRAAGLGIWLFHLPTVIGLPAIYAEVFETRPPGRRPASAGGWGCDLTWEAALQGAVLEALQCRLTVIAGARDDMLYGRRRRVEATPLPPGVDALRWSDLAASGWTACDADPDTIVRRLAGAGYPDAAFVRLSAPQAPVCVVKVFVPGLGADHRTRRPSGRIRP